MSKADLEISDEELLDKLGLISDCGRLKRAALLMFHRDAHSKVTGAYIKVGYFETDADLRYQDEIEGSLFMQADRVMEMIYLKYLKAEITYDNVTRIEKYPFPKDGIREAVYNSLIHKSYASGIPIQISVYKDRMYIGNSCVFPPNWTVETLFEKHNSNPYNPDIARTFFRAGLVEAWGRGIEKICNECKEHGIPLPEFTVHPEDIMVKFSSGEIPSRHPAISPSRQVGEMENKYDEQIIEILRLMPSITYKDMSEKLEIPMRTLQRRIKSLREAEKLKRIGGNRYGYWEICD
jgi:ATP-dependent DNA helicase RecG